MPDRCASKAEGLLLLSSIALVVGLLLAAVPPIEPPGRTLLACAAQRSPPHGTLVGRHRRHVSWSARGRPGAGHPRSRHKGAATPARVQANECRVLQRPGYGAPALLLRFDMPPTAAATVTDLGSEALPRGSRCCRGAYHARWGRPAPVRRWPVALRSMCGGRIVPHRTPGPSAPRGLQLAPLASRRRPEQDQHRTDRDLPGATQARPCTTSPPCPQ